MNAHTLRPSAYMKLLALQLRSYLLSLQSMTETNNERKHNYVITSTFVSPYNCTMFNQNTE